MPSMDVLKAFWGDLGVLILVHGDRLLEKLGKSTEDYFPLFENGDIYEVREY
jgi:hypothetical protein